MVANFDPTHFLKHISLDCVIFGFHDTQLKVLLLHMKYSNLLALPGGFLKEDESLDMAAVRVLQERTGLSNIFLRQFKVFSDPKRSEENQATVDLVATGVKEITLKWFNQRFISVGYYALVDPFLVDPQPDIFSDYCDWVAVDQVEGIIMDHRQILDEALTALRMEISHQPIGYNLMAEKFTMPELQKLYEAILGKTLDRRNFQRKMRSYNILNRLDQRKQGGAYKAPYLYEFNLENYHKALQSGWEGNW
jgi:hypothetical protein